LTSPHRKGNKSSEKPCAASVLKEYVETKKKRDNEAATQDSLEHGTDIQDISLRDQIEIKRSLYEKVTSVEMGPANA
jgi:hypothetical protein